MIAVDDFVRRLEAAVLSDDQDRIAHLARAANGDRLREACCRHAANYVWRSRGGYGPQIVESSLRDLWTAIHALQQGGAHAGR